MMGTRVRRSRRGSALIFAVILIAAITLFFVVAQGLITATLRQQIRFEDRSKATYAMRSVAAHARYEVLSSAFTLPTVRNYTIGSYSVVANIRDNSTNVPSTISIEMSAVRAGRTYKSVEIVGTGATTNSAWSYALFATGQRSHVNPLVVGTWSAPANVYLGTSATNGNGSTIYGNLDCSGSINSSFWVSGTKSSNVPIQSLPSFSIAGLLASITVGYTTLGSTFSGTYKFQDHANGEHPVYYRSGNLEFNCYVTGFATFIVDGDVLLTRLDYVGPGTCVAVIASGNIVIPHNKADFGGIFLTPGLFWKQDGGRGTKVSNIFGAILTGGLTTDVSIQLTHDRTVLDYPDQGRRLHLPGF